MILALRVVCFLSTVILLACRLLLSIFLLRALVPVYICTRVRFDIVFNETVYLELIHATHGRCADLALERLRVLVQSGVFHGEHRLHGPLLCVVLATQLSELRIPQMDIRLWILVSDWHMIWSRHVCVCGRFRRAWMHCVLWYGFTLVR